MRNELYWVAGPWPGRLALSARPRGGDWLSDELASWKRAGIDSVISLLTPEEQRDLGLLKEGGESQKQGLAFSSFPIPDREVPASEARFNEALRRANEGLSRTGMSPSAAVDLVSAARGLPIPETTEQRDWIERYAPAVTK
jgi:hypothetical protein